MARETCEQDVALHELPETRQSLLLRLEQKSDHAWREFVQIYERAIRDFCRRRGLQDADARDVTQEVLAAVDDKVAAWKHGQEHGSFRGWLFRVARNLAVSSIRRRTRQATGTGDTGMVRLLSEIPQRGGDDEDAFWLEYRRSLVQWAARRVRSDVSEQSWEIFWRTAVRGISPREVALDLGLSVGSVYTAKCRVFARLKAETAQLDDNDAPDALELNRMSNDEQQLCDSTRDQ